MLSIRPARPFLGAALAFCLIGCADPDGEYELFNEREAEVAKPPVVSGACGETVKEVEGDFFFALSASADALKPIMFLNTITTEADGLHFSIQPLKYDDRKTPVGPPIVLSAYPIDAEGKFTAPLPQLSVPGEANPISKGAPIVATVTLTGTVCADLICGDFDGNVIMPVEIPLTGSTFSMQRVESPDDYTEPPVISCAGDVAMTLEELLK